ncbi:MAG: YihY/virulence factor BrkB family protein [Gammaproteobacteria bacterium]|nr:YihY/virulence factor BrkB family protein [Gammaproteobacteria bacterium]
MALVPLVEVLAEMQLDIIGSSWNKFFNVASGRTVGFVITGIIISVIYTVIPYSKISWPERLLGIAVATILIEIGKEFFTQYVKFASSYDALYGSVSSVIVLLLWLYFSAHVILYGSELISVTRDSNEHTKPNLA